MAESTSGKALYAVHQGTYVVKLIGEIRVPICNTLDSFIEGMFNDRQLNSVLIDLSEATLIDSTALGLLAKIAIRTQKRFNQKPLIICTEPDIRRVMDAMGFDKVFNIVHEAPVKSPQMSEMPAICCDDVSACEKVLEAHRVLMGMNDQNRETFKDVVAVLESQSLEPVGQEKTSASCQDVKHHRYN